MAEQPRLLRTGRAMAAATFVSRVTGFGRTLALAAALGLGTHLLEAHTVANTVPNTIYDLLLGGALAGVIVPLLVRADAEESVDEELFAQRLLSLVVYVLSAAVIVTIAAAPVIIDLYASGLSPAERQAAIVFARFFLPQLLFYGVSATLAAVLNARGRLVSPMWAPVANNLVVIATVLLYLVIGGTGRLATLTQGQTLLLAIGTTAGIAAQALVLALAGRRSGFRLRLRADPRGIGLRRIAAMAGWTLASVIAGHCVFLVTTNLSSTAGLPGAIGISANAWALFQLPYAVIAVTVVTGVLPRMSRAAAERDLSRVTADLSRCLRLTGFALVPTAVALVVLGPRISTTLFAHGNASPAAAQLTGSMLAAYGLALVPYAGYQIMLRVFYALSDTRTPALIGVGVSAVAVTGCLVAGRMTRGADLIVAIALAWTLASVAGLVATALVLRRRIGRVDGHRLLDAHARMLAAALAAGAGAAVTVRALGPAAGTAWHGSVTVLTCAVAVGAVLYVLAARCLRVGELRGLGAVFRINAS
ncbi:murein biosynthesis integral membrane protein MurJ [Streptosporangium sp. CA-135522]|uniref:murein biosynthesis integral membrane protein MurJ n=1 Tax=Streptosporangium sp. CA-135522 TaxID=3240072 RepID=UPI003D8F4AFE